MSFFHFFILGLQNTKKKTPRREVSLKKHLFDFSDQLELHQLHLVYGCFQRFLEHLLVVEVSF